MPCILCLDPNTRYKLREVKECNWQEVIQKYGGIEIVESTGPRICRKCGCLALAVHKKASQFYEICQKARQRLYEEHALSSYVLPIAPPPNMNPHHGSDASDAIRRIITQVSEKGESSGVNSAGAADVPPMKRSRLEGPNDEHNYFLEPQPMQTITPVAHSSGTGGVNGVSSEPGVKKSLPVKLTSSSTTQLSKQSPLVAKVLVSKPNPHASVTNSKHVPLVASVVGFANLHATKADIENAKTSCPSSTNVRVAQLLPNTSQAAPSNINTGSIISTGGSIVITPGKNVIVTQGVKKVTVTQGTKSKRSPTTKSTVPRTRKPTKVLSSKVVKSPKKPNLAARQSMGVLNACSTPFGGKILISRPLYATSHVQIRPAPGIAAASTSTTNPDRPIANTPLAARAHAIAKDQALPQITVKEYQTIIATLQTGDAKLLADVLLESSTVRQSITRKLVREVITSVDKLGTGNSMAMLRTKGKDLKDAIKDFSYEEVVNENLQVFPTLVDMLLGLCVGVNGVKDKKKLETVTTRIGFALSILLFTRHWGCLGFVQRMNTIILHKFKRKVSNNINNDIL